MHKRNSLQAAVIALSSLLIRDKAGGGNQGIFLIVALENAELYEIQAERKSQRKELVGVLTSAVAAAPRLTMTKSVNRPSNSSSSESMTQLFKHIASKAEQDEAETASTTQAFVSIVQGRLQWYERLRDMILPIIRDGNTPAANKRLINKVGDVSVGCCASETGECEERDSVGLFRQGSRRLSNSLRRTHSALSDSTRYISSRLQRRPSISQTFFNSFLDD